MSSAFCFTANFPTDKSLCTVEPSPPTQVWETGNGKLDRGQAELRAKRCHERDGQYNDDAMRRVDVQSKGAIIDGRPDRSGCRTAPPAPPAATRVTRLRGPKWPSFGACSLSHLQSSTQERRKTAGSPPKPPWIHRQGPSAWCGTGGATARSPRRLQKSLTSKHAKSMQILSHCDKYCHTHG